MTRRLQWRITIPKTKSQLGDKKEKQKAKRTSASACWITRSRSATSKARTLPVSMTRGKTLAAMRMAMNSDAIGSKPVHP